MKNNMNNIMIVECNDHKEIYGLLRINKTTKEVQDEIHNIKQNFEKSNYEWSILEVFNEFPSSWVWEFFPCDKHTKIAEI